MRDGAFIRTMGHGRHVTERTLHPRDADRLRCSAAARKRSHRDFVHPSCSRPVTLSGKLGEDAERYQERAVAGALQEIES